MLSTRAHACLCGAQRPRAPTVPVRGAVSNVSGHLEATVSRFLGSAPVASASTSNVGYAFHNTSYYCYALGCFANTRSAGLVDNLFF